MGYDGGFAIDTMIGAISEYDDLENVGVIIMMIGGSFLARTQYDVKATRLTFSEWRAQGSTKEKAVANLLMKFIKRFGPRNWKGLL